MTTQNDKTAVEWRPVSGTRGLYEVSSGGSVRRTVGGSAGRTLKSSDTKGYRLVDLSVDGVIRKVAVHSLVLEAFVGPRPAGMQCAHGDGVRSNNRVENLRWATVGENAQDRIAHGTQTRGETHRRAKLTESDVREIHRRLIGGEARANLAREFRVDHALVSGIASGRNWGWLALPRLAPSGRSAA